MRELTRIAAGARALSAVVDLMVCPPATLIAECVAAANGSPLRIGAQDCHSEPSGAFTGDLSAEMLKDAGAEAVIIGHSERRAHHGETDTLVRAKALAARRAGLLAVVCVGETQAERHAGRALTIVGAQLDASLPDGATAENLMVAYEPVWAIGSGLTPTPTDVAEMHACIRGRLAARFGATGEKMGILYGGSVKAANALGLMRIANVDGALVGGASLKAGEFLSIAGVYGGAAGTG